MHFSSVEDVIATRRLVWAEHNGARIAVILRIGKPMSLTDSDDDYGCPYQIIGIDKEAVKCAVGVDGIQALYAALVMADADLQSINDRSGGKLEWEVTGESDFGLLGPPSRG